MSRQTTWIVVGFIAAGLLLYGFLAVQVSAGDPSATVNEFREKLLGYGGWAALVSGSLMLLQSVVPPIPSNVITITNGLVFGPVWGALLSWTTMLLGACICFFLSRRIGRPFATRIVGPSLDNAEGFFKRYGVHAVFLIRIMPFVPFDAVSYAAGLLNIPFPRFVLASGLGLIPSVIIYSYVGPIVLAQHSWILPIGFGVTATLALLLVRLLQRPVPRPVGQPELPS